MNTIMLLYQLLESVNYAMLHMLYIAMV